MEHTNNAEEEHSSNEEYHNSNVTGKKGTIVKTLACGCYKAIKANFSVLSIVLIVIIATVYLSQSFIDSIWLDETWYAWAGQLIQYRIMHLHDLITGNNSEFVVNLFSFKLGYDRMFPAFIIGILNFFIVSFYSMRIMGWLFAIAGIIGSYLLGKSLKNEFTGIMSMLLIATHHWYYFLSLKGLTDVAIVSMLILFTYCLYNATKKPTKGNIIITILVAILTILTKAQGLAVLPIGGAYVAFLFIRNWRSIVPQILKNNTYKIGAGVVITIFVFIMYFFRKLFMAYATTADYSLIINVFMNDLPALLHSDIISYAFIVGVLLAIVYRKNGYVLMTLMSTIVFLPIATYSGIEQRILLPVIAPVYILGVIGLQEIGGFVNLFVKGIFKHSKIVICLIIFLVLLFGTILPNYETGKNLVEQRRYWYSGYPEAMDWVHKNIPWNGKDLFIPNFYACCNYNVGLLNNDIRRVNNSRNVFNRYDGMGNWALNGMESFELFEKHVKENPNETIYVMADVWEPYQSEWHKIDLANPEKTQFNLQRIEQLGFRIVYQVQRPVPTTQGLVDIPALLIYRRN